MAFEGQNKGTWSKQTALVPVTEMGEEFVFSDDGVADPTAKIEQGPLVFQSSRKYTTDRMSIAS